MPRTAKFVKGRQRRCKFVGSLSAIRDTLSATKSTRGRLLPPPQWTVVGWPNEASAAADNLGSAYCTRISTAWVAAPSCSTYRRSSFNFRGRSNHKRKRWNLKRTCDSQVGGSRVHWCGIHRFKWLCPATHPQEHSRDSLEGGRGGTATFAEADKLARIPWL